MASLPLSRAELFDLLIKVINAHPAEFKKWAAEALVEKTDFELLVEDMVGDTLQVLMNELNKLRGEE